MQAFQIHNKDGDVLCTYKDKPTDPLPTVGFIGPAAAELLQGTTCRILRYRTLNGATCAAGVYGGNVVSIPVTNGGW